jgi:hypothetical protein
MRMLLKAERVAGRCVAAGDRNILKSPREFWDRKFGDVRGAQATHAEDAKTQQFVNALQESWDTKWHVPHLVPARRIIVAQCKCKVLCAGVRRNTTNHP